MAGITVRRRTLINTISVTRTTLNIGVQTGQREAGVVMVEGHISPAAGVMTGTASGAKLTIVPVFRSVTGITILGCALINAVDMTRTA